MEVIGTNQGFVPHFTMGTMTTYFVQRQVSSNKNAPADFSPISDKAYHLFHKGYAQKIKVRKPADGDCCSFRCKVQPQMKAGMYFFELVVVVNVNGKDVCHVE